MRKCGAVTGAAKIVDEPIVLVISIDTAHVRGADQYSAPNFELVVARCGRGGRGERAVAISSPAAPTSRQSAIVLFTLSRKSDIAALGM
ncbi:hypothetical protein A6B35_29620 (plasmid) [Mesorhizobium amorphae CCNWGS0123]|nr:hypothetical protein A6B35_29620 [Mesorhizobium amorphae CCNWGS0123]